MQHFMNTLTNPFAQREGNPVSPPARPEEARRAVSKGGAEFDSPGEYVAIFKNEST